MDLEKHPPQAPPAAQPPAAAAELRASDADRDRTADILRDALAEGRLTAEEHAERVDGVYRAKTVAELAPLVQDLPAPRERHQGAQTYAYAPERTGVPAAPDENLVAVFSSTTRKGRWRVARRTHVYAIFGNVEIDLTEAIFEHQRVVIKAVSVFGNVEVTVPENISLHGSGSGVFGNFEVETLDSGNPQAPVVFIDGYSVLGNIEAKPKRGKFVQDLSDRFRKHLGH
ncbi:DUF1707 domain-containing protein [Streptomyces sp. E11-3]|uniref:DUF1707 SHOCT-like domain-containing protein n=1 Tax=Streptomyces sp. E11-3 TaxID=3110112 RepID=UPI0039803706